MTEIEQPGGVTRRKMVAYLIAGPTLIASARWGTGTAEAAVPTVQVTDTYDLSDLLTQAALPTAGSISVVMHGDGTASFDLHRAEVGQGITTAVAMLISDELDLSIDKVKIRLADARPELNYNQLTGGSNTIFAIYEPVRMAAATARAQMMSVAADELRVLPGELTVVDGLITAPNGKTRTYGELAGRAAVAKDLLVKPQLKAARKLKLEGNDVKRIDGPAIVKGEKVFAMDLKVPGALPTMICRAPDINGKVVSVDNLAEVKAMPGITDVAVVERTQFVQGGVAVRGKTFGQCIDAIRALKVKWAGSSASGKSDKSVLADLKAAELPMTPALPGEVLEDQFTFWFRPGDPLEPNCAVADVRADRAEIWSSLKSPIYLKQQVASTLGLAPEKVIVHVTEGGGSFGRHLFADGAFEAAAVSKLFGKPVRLMWARTDGSRQGRAHPMCTSRVRITRSGDQVLAFDQRHTSVQTDFTHGLGEMLTSVATSAGLNFATFSETVFTLTANVPYNFGAVTQLLNEIYDFNTFNTSSVRNIYSPDVRTAGELMVDRTAKAMGKDPMAFRREFAHDDRMRAVLDRVAKEAQWGKAMPAGTAQGIGMHSEYKGRAACIVEIDTRPETVNRKIREAFTGARVTKATFVVDVGKPVNTLGLKAQMMGGIMDGIANALSYSLHLVNGNFLEGSWSNAHYTRQWNTPPEVNVLVMKDTNGVAGGAGELGVAASMAATACAYARATGTNPTSFPINHDGPLFFEPFPTVPPVPASPVDGLEKVGIKPTAKKKAAKKKPTARRKTTTKKR